MTIAHVKSSEDLSLLVEELGEHSDEESMGVEEDESTTGLQENYNSLLEKSGEYVRMAKATIKKMKKAEKDYRSLLVRYKEAKCKIETLNGELTEAYSKTKFLELEVVQANAKVERVSSKKLNEEPMVATIKAKKVKLEKKMNVTDQRVLNKPRNQSVVRSEAKGKSLPKSQRGPRTDHLCHHCGL